MSEETADFFLEIRDSYFARLKQVDQELSKTRIRTYQALAAEILGFFTFVRVFSSFDLHKSHVRNYLFYDFLDVITWCLVLSVIIGFFLSFRFIYQIEKPKEWHIPAANFDALAGIHNPTNVTDLLRFYLPTMEQDVLADENAMENVKVIYSKLTKLLAFQVITLGVTGSTFLLNWLFTRF